MSRSGMLVALLASAAAGAGTMWWLAGRHTHTVSAAPEPATRQVLYWYDPMVPTQRFDQPGKSPFMDMPLVPKYAGEGPDGDGTVHIDARLAQNLGVRTALATRRTSASVVRATGTVAFDERGVTLVHARVAGIVERLAVRTPLTTVEAGQPLLTLIAPEWTAAQAEYLALRATRSTGLAAVGAAARQRLLLLGMSERQIADVERRGHAGNRIVIPAPRSGVVSELLVRDGASVVAGTPLARIQAFDTVWVNAAIPETQVARIAQGSVARIELPAYPGESLAGTVEVLLPDLDSATRTQTARIVVPNAAHRLVPGMFARVTISGRAAAAPLVQVPTEAVIATGLRQVVIVDAGDGRFRAQEVQVGDEDDGATNILAGLDEGDRVVLSGQFLIDSEASMAGTLARLGSAGSPASEGMPYPASGRVEQIEGERWVIATDPVPELRMGAMRMRFLHRETVPGGGIRLGQRVHFAFVRNADGDFEIVTIAAASAGEAP